MCAGHDHHVFLACPWRVHDMVVSCARHEHCMRTPSPWRVHGTIISCAWHDHLVCTSPWRVHGTIISRAWRVHSTSITCACCIHSVSMTRGWAVRDTSVVCPWCRHGISMTRACRVPGVYTAHAWCLHTLSMVCAEVCTRHEHCVYVSVACAPPRPPSSSMPGSGGGWAQRSPHRSYWDQCGGWGGVRVCRKDQAGSRR